MGTITVTNTNDSGPGSLRNAVADSQKNESTDSDGADILLGSATGVRPIFANTPIPFPATNPSPSFNDTNDILIGNGYSDGNNSLNRNNQTLIIVSDTNQLFSSGVGSVEVTLLLPAVQKVREAALLSGGSSSDGAWAALDSTFELTSGSYPYLTL